MTEKFCSIDKVIIFDAKYLTAKKIYEYVWNCWNI